MMHNNHFMFWAARSLGKSWLTSLFCVVRCILFPKTKICVASGTRTQANEVLSKILDDFCKNFTWGSNNLNREIKEFSLSMNNSFIKFRNGSWIKVVTASDNGRGARANIIVLDEFRMIDKNTINTVLKRFLGTPRQPNFLNKPEYANQEKYLESNIEIYMSSCWFVSHWSYEKSKAFTANLLSDKMKYFVCALPYQVAIKEGLKKRSEIEEEMSESDFDQSTFDMEMGCLPHNDIEGAFFTFDNISKQRKLKTAIYPFENSKVKVPNLALNERRILSLDVALMASTKNNNDASCVIINSAIPSSNNTYTSNIIYLQNYEGEVTEDLALKVRRLFHFYKCTDLVIDALNGGLSVYDILIRDIYDPENGEIYPALSCCNDSVMADRCKVDKAKKVIWSIKANPAFNNEICVALRSGFSSGKINLLIPENEGKEVLKKRIKDFDKLTTANQLDYEMPYIQTTLLIYELINLEYEVKGTNVRVFEKSGMRKDRYSSLAYNYWVQCQLEREFLQETKKGFKLNDYATTFKKLNKKAKLY